MREQLELNQVTDKLLEKNNQALEDNTKALGSITKSLGAMDLSNKKELGAIAKTLAEISESATSGGITAQQSKALVKKSNDTLAVLQDIQKDSTSDGINELVEIASFQKRLLEKGNELAKNTLANLADKAKDTAKLPFTIGLGMLASEMPAVAMALSGLKSFAGGVKDVWNDYREDKKAQKEQQLQISQDRSLSNIEDASFDQVEGVDGAVGLLNHIKLAMLSLGSSFRFFNPAAKRLKSIDESLLDGDEHAVLLKDLQYYQKQSGEMLSWMSTQTDTTNSILREVRDNIGALQIANEENIPKEERQRITKEENDAAIDQPAVVSGGSNVIPIRFNQSEKNEQPKDDNRGVDPFLILQGTRLNLTLPNLGRDELSELFDDPDAASFEINRERFKRKKPDYVSMLQDWWPAAKDISNEFADYLGDYGFDSFTDPKSMYEAGLAAGDEFFKGVTEMLEDYELPVPQTDKDWKSVIDGIEQVFYSYNLRLGSNNDDANLLENMFTLPEFIEKAAKGLEEISGNVVSIAQDVDSIDDRTAQDAQDKEEERREALDQHKDLLKALEQRDKAQEGTKDDEPGFLSKLFDGLGIDGEGIMGALAGALGLKWLLGGKGKGLGTGGLLKNLKFGKLAKGTGILGLVLTAFDVISESFDAYWQNPDAGIAHAIGEGVKNTAINMWDMLNEISDGMWDFASGLTGIEEISSENIAKVDAKIAETISNWADSAIGFWDRMPVVDVWDRMQLGVSDAIESVVNNINSIGDSQKLLSDTVAASRKEWWNNIKNGISAFFEDTGELIVDAMQSDPNVVFVETNRGFLGQKTIRPRRVYGADSVTGPQQRYSQEIQDIMNNQRRLQEEQRRARDTGQNGGTAIISNPTYNSSNQTIIMPSSPVETDFLVNKIDMNNEAP